MLGTTGHGRASACQPPSSARASCEHTNGLQRTTALRVLTDQTPPSLAFRVQSLSPSFREAGVGNGEFPTPPSAALQQSSVCHLSHSVPTESQDPSSHHQLGRGRTRTRTRTASASACEHKARPCPSGMEALAPHRIIWRRAPLRERGIPGRGARERRSGTCC